MKAGRSGVVAAMGRKRRQDAYKDQNSDIELGSITNIDSQLSRQGVLTLYNTPVAVWAAGTLIIVCGFYLLYHLIWGKEGRIFDGFNQGYWWQYFIACIILVIGFAFVFAVRMEKIEFNKQHDFVTMNYTNICCRQTRFSKKLTQLFNVTIVKRGQDTVQNKTLHYKLILNFDDGGQLEIMETNSQRKIKAKYIQIKVFLGQQADLNQIYIVDESSQPK